MTDSDRSFRRAGAPARTARCLAVLLLAALTIATAPARAAAPNDAQAACLLTVDKALASMSKAEGKHVASCVKAAAAGKLAQPTIAACIDADAKGKVATASEKAAAAIQKACTEAPPFGTTDLTGGAAVAAAAGVREALVKNLFGDDLDAAIAAKSSDVAAATCQGALRKAVDKCWAARMNAYRECVPGTFTLPLPGAADMGACRSSDPEGEVQAACVTAIQDTLDRKCGGVDLDVRLPGCECRYPQDCVQVAIANAENRLLTAGANLPAADPVLPFVRRTQAADNDPWLLPVHGEFVATRIHGKEEDAPLACPLGALNIYTVYDAQADLDYNAGILPYIVDQGIRVLFSPHAATDLTGTSPAEMVQEHQAMPLYADAEDFLHLATRREMHDLAPLKAAQVGTTMRFGQQACLHDCDALYAELPPPNIVFGARLLLIHFNVDRDTLEDAVAGLASEADALFGVDLRWVGRTVAELKFELVDGTIVPAFNPLPATGSLVYELAPGVDPAAEVLTLPNLSAFLAASSSEAVVLGE